MYKEDTFWRLGAHFFTKKNDYTKNYNILNLCLKYLPETRGQ